MTKQSRIVVGATALAACGTYVSSDKAFVPTLGGSGGITPSSSALRGSQIDQIQTASEGGVSTSGLVAAFGLAGTVAASVSRTRNSRAARYAEPVSAAAAAAAAAAASKAAGAAGAAGAAKAGAAVGATKTGAAVAGSGATGKLKKDAESKVFDKELDSKKMMPQDRGSPEYERYMAQKQAVNRREWDARTTYNADGVFGDKRGRDVEGSNLDPLETTDGYWSYLGKPGTFSAKRQPGVNQPLDYFDPAGFCDEDDEAKFKNLRAAEIKHGRVAMMAALGAVVQHYVKFPGFERVPSGLAAVNVPPGSYGMIALFVVAGALETTAWVEKPNKQPGNFGDPLNLNQYTKEFRDREINNGRFAMFAALGIIAAELYTGRDAVEQFYF
eukprot:TRINITY_DN7793_c0_g1_i1.p1 TRINITY_DN7793_c0_g1~~TRINITY_DN7793_c0_g1_i1.p1  ORF type:complete len:385 (-),score=113.00 TRINITY_DN7793_c0_g1_i1:283-1437(-)